MERLCVFCKHWYFSGGDPGYSELTPGTDASMECMKGHYGPFKLWDLLGAEDFRGQILKAQTCPDYERPTP